MELIIEILTVITCILLVLVVLVQDSKGGGLSSAFGGSNQVLGVRQTTDFLEKATWVLAISLLAFSLLSAYFMKSSQGTVSNGIESVSKQRADATATPQQQQQAPQQQQQQAPQQQPQGSAAPAGNGK